MVAYSLGLAIWAIFMLEYWKRREKTLALEWGMVGYESHELNRPGMINSPLYA
jgi:hypothetical protein